MTRINKETIERARKAMRFVEVLKARRHTLSKGEALFVDERDDELERFDDAAIITLEDAAYLEELAVVHQ
ncbi:MAG: hypothetical protein HY231_02965 [Acidobacteria bacterium]|nr:hypothetical protein [Acidobacteriota bacterium]